MKHLVSTLVFLLMLTLTQQASAVVTGEMIMVRSSEQFPEAMSMLQASIRQHGYEVSRVQRVDIGLSTKGYKTDKYRVVFLGKGPQIQELSHKYPQLIPYLPLKVAIFAEDDSTIMVAANPAVYRDMFKIPELIPVFEQWQKDMTSILNTVQNQN